MFQLWLLLNGYPCLLPSQKGTINARFGILLDATNSLEADILCEGHFGIYKTKKEVRDYILSYRRQYGVE